MGRPRKFEMQAVLAAARAEFQAKGYAATSCDDLMTATGLGKGSMYGAFGDKHHLFLEVLGDYSAARVEAVRCSLSRDEPAIATLRALFRSEPGACPRGCLLVNSTCELSPHDAEVVALARSTFAAVEDLLAETVQRACDAGDLPAETEPRELARLLLAILQGQGFLAKTGMAPEALARIGEVAAAKLLEGPPASSDKKPRRRPARAPAASPGPASPSAAPASPATTAMASAPGSVPAASPAEQRLIDICLGKASMFTEQEARLLKLVDTNGRPDLVEQATSIREHRIEQIQLGCAKLRTEGKVR